MSRFIVKRVIYMIPVILVVTLVIFILSYLSAGDAARILAEKKYEHPTPVQIEEVRHEEGLDQPIMVQYGRWLSKAVRGDFGKSYATGEPAIYELKRCFPNTAKLAISAIIILVLVSFPLGALAALFEDRLIDKIIRVFCSLTVAMPSFWLALMMLYFFGVKLGMINVIGGSSGTVPILAPIAMDIGFFGIMIRLIRVNMIQVYKKDFIRASLAKGLPMYNVILKHGAKNIMIPVITRMISIIIGTFCGSAVIESIFSIDGIGNLALDAVLCKNTPVLQCFIFILAISVVVINLIVDIIYSLIDRRIQLK